MLELCSDLEVMGEGALAAGFTLINGLLLLIQSALPF